MTKEMPPPACSLWATHLSPHLGVELLGHGVGCSRPYQNLPNDFYVVITDSINPV